jgi:hypothetical protein
MIQARLVVARYNGRAGIEEIVEVFEGASTRRPHWKNPTKKTA